MNYGRQQLELVGKGVSSASTVSKDPCLQSVSLRLENLNMSGYTAAIGIAKLLGQDEIVAMLTEGLDDEDPAQPFPVVRAYAEMADEDDMDFAVALRLRKVARQ